MDQRTVSTVSALTGNRVPFAANRPQAQAFVVMPNEMYAFIGRGGGKTVGIMAPWILHKVNVMPRSNGGLIGKTFTDIETKILQPLFMAFEQLGLQKDIDYCYGKRPPEDWDKPFTPVIDFKHVLSFPNGTIMELISLHLKGSANGKSLQWIVCDEAKFVDEVQLRGEVFPILRGHVRHFGKSPWYGAKLFVTDKLSPNIDWLLAKRNLVDHDAVRVVIHYQLEVNSLKASLAGASDSATYNINRKIVHLEHVLTALRKNLVYVVEASAMDNIANLSPDFFKNMRRSLTKYEYSVAIENQDPTRVENCFYPDRAERHLYASDFDEDANQPLGVVMDYQASLSPLVAFQVNDLVCGYDTLNFLSATYVKHPFGLKEVIDEFCLRNEHRPCKHIYYFYDHTAIGRQNGSLAFDARVAKYFEDNGWEVDKIYMGKAPNKDLQYDEIRAALQNTSPDPLQIRFNHEGCATLIMSMDRTETRTNSKGATVKNKYNETVLTYPQEYATHFSDCFDQVFHAVINMELYPRMNTVSPGLNGFRR